MRECKFNIQAVVACVDNIYLKRRLMSNRKSYFFVIFLLLSSLWLAGCGSLLNAAEEAVGGDYGPEYVPQEQQTRTFEALWKHLTDSYIYFDTADVDWNALHDKYDSQIQAGLTDEQFADSLGELQAELPPGAFLYQSRSERIQADVTDAS